MLLEVPNVAIHPITHLNQSLGKLVDERVASVHQVFSGPVAGDALLLLDPIAAATLTELLTDVPPLSMDLDPSAREVFTEVGNIVLNACIGTFGNMLEVPVSFSVPDVDVTNVHTVIDRMLESGDAFRYALVITAGFRLRESAVTGYVVIVLEMAQSLGLLLPASAAAADVLAALQRRGGARQDSAAVFTVLNNPEET